MHVYAVNTNSMRFADTKLAFYSVLKLVECPPQGTSTIIGNIQ